MTLTLIRRILLIFRVKMSSSASGLLLPTGVRGMIDLDREKFSRNITVPILKVSDEKLSKITQICKPYFLKLSNFKPVQSLQDKNGETVTKCIYFDPVKVSKWLDISENARTSLKQQSITEDNYETKEIQLSYDNFKYDEIFKAVLPKNEEVVSGFSQIGHIIHLNLRDHLLDYRSLIGQVLIDKINTCRTVVNKSNIIDNTYRNFSMEVIAGEEDFLVTVKENRCNFQFDFSKVYWNPRLCKEHERILEFLKPGDILFDVFCGVGPFAVPAAKRKSRVFANDLNPESFKWLNHNAKQNKVNMNLFKSFNIDGKDFICNTFRDFILDYCNGMEKLDKGAKIHITMNLPAMAVEFLKNFNGLIKEFELKDKFNCEILVHVYCFAIGEDPYAIAKKMVCENIGKDVTDLISDIFDVRNVSPKKEMMRVTFKLTKEILFSSNEGEENSEPPSKKHCSSVQEE
ncbi:tRNA (guanine(37)-N1)-methyltransferase [Maniola hyperantus]|uniref:tRNA (guanine(37)-N1)-methyltransferase n=1 Tax=Aphantopus hyperantus TaxID=2795564 RepID=UPI001569DF0F|nr:tRNA (guanine(37)-N1)-methyltransferase [Maniola hyperantus]